MIRLAFVVAALALVVAAVGGSVLGHVPPILAFAVYVVGAAVAAVNFGVLLRERA